MLLHALDRAGIEHRYVKAIRFGLEHAQGARRVPLPDLHVVYANRCLRCGRPEALGDDASKTVRDLLAGVVVAPGDFDVGTIAALPLVEEADDFESGFAEQ